MYSTFLTGKTQTQTDMHFPKNKYTACPHTCVLCIFKCRHMQKTKRMLSHVITHTDSGCSWSDPPSHELWAGVFALCMKGNLYFITLSRGEIWAGAAAVWEYFTFSDEPTNGGRRLIPNQNFWLPSGSNHTKSSVMLIVHSNTGFLEKSYNCNSKFILHNSGSIYYPSPGALNTRLMICPIQRGPQLVDDGWRSRMNFDVYLFT